MNNIATIPHQQQRPNNPFDMAQPSRPEDVNAGAVSIEQERAIAEARGQIQLAKMFPRSMSAATAELLEACKSQEFSKSAFYSVPNRGSGPSIRFAEEVARCYGNFEYGHRELSRSKGKSEIEVFAWDKEKNNVSKRQITVAHIRDTKHGPKPLRDQADIDNRIANVASKQMRGRILALLPKALVELGVAECRKTLTGRNGASVSAQVSSLIASFSEFGVSPERLGEYIGHSIDNCTVDDITDLIGVYNALNEGARISDYFDSPEPDSAAGKSTSLNARLTASQPAPVDQLLKHLPACTTKQDLDDWKTDANTWPDGSAERVQLIEAYKTHVSNLAHAAKNQE